MFQCDSACLLDGTRLLELWKGIVPVRCYSAEQSSWHAWRDDSSWDACMGPVVPVCCHSAVRAWHRKTPPGMHGVVPVCCHSMVQGGTDDSWDGVAPCVLLQCGAWRRGRLPCWDGVSDRAVALPGIISSSATPLQVTMDGLHLMPPSTASHACMHAGMVPF